MFSTGVGELGLKPHEFWALTFAEFTAMVEAYQRTQTNKRNDLVTLAWLTASLSRQQKMPALKSLLIEEKPKVSKEQAPEQMVNACKTIAAALGGNFIEVTD